MNWTIVDSWMEDGDDYNIDRVGHRRTYSAVYAFDTKNSKAAEYGVA